MSETDVLLAEVGRASRIGSVITNKEGNGFPKLWLTRLVRRLPVLEEIWLAGVARAFNRSLDELEKHPIFFSAGGSLASTQEVPFQEYLEKARILQEVLETSPSRKLQPELHRLKYRVEALRYRIEIEKPQTANPLTIRKIKNLADTWKASKIFFDDKFLTNIDAKLLEGAWAYDHFVERLVEDTELREIFFEWTLRDRNNPDTFIQYPNMQKKLTEIGLARRIGFCGAEALKIRKMGSGGSEKVLTLPFEGRDINILNPKKIVEFRGDYVLTMEEVFRNFQDRWKQVGNLEYFQGRGICNWNPKRFGLYNARTDCFESIDFDKEQWWEDLPAIKEISVEEATERYKVPCDGSQWVISLKSSREQANLHPVGTHSYFEVAIPCSGRYKLFTFGKFTEEFPQTLFNYLDLISNTLSAVICGPDENIFYTNRQHAGPSALRTPEQGAKFMASIKRNVLDSRRGNFVFQFLSNNCSKWAWKKARHHLGKEIIPDFFAIPFTKIKPVGLLRIWMAVLSALPYLVRLAVLTVLSYAMGAWRSRTVTKKNGELRRISLLDDPPWKRGNVFYHPGQYYFFEKN